MKKFVALLALLLAPIANASTAPLTTDYNLGKVWMGFTGGKIQGMPILGVYNGTTLVPLNMDAGGNLSVAVTSPVGGQAVYDQVASTTFTESSATTSSTLLLAANPNRRYLMVQNRGTDYVYVKTDAVQTGTEGLSIPPGGNYEPNKVIPSALYIKSASGTQTIEVIEGN